jgi:PKD repeat protein
MGSSMEFWAEDSGLEPATTLEPDWFIGEDFDLRGDTEPGFRNMGDPGEDGDPSHYDERYTGSDDNGGVHTNSGIANHWYYLLVNGGQNSDPNYASGTDVTEIGLAAAEPIAFLGFTALPADATFCDARDSTIAVAGTYDANVADAWDEVGVDDALCGGGNAAPTADFTYTTTDLTVDFTDQSTDSDGSVVAWSWGFGDGATSTEQNPSHTYARDGTYTVKLTVTDDDGATDPASQDVTVSEGGGGGTMHVSAIDMWYSTAGPNYFVYTQVTIVDDTGSVVSDATVDVTTTLPDGSPVSDSGVTGSDGTATLKAKYRQTGTYTSEVTNVTHGSLTYDPNANVETSETLTVP